MADRRYVRLLLETSEDTIFLGEGTLDWSAVTGPPHALVVPQLPELLRAAADALESAQTTGPPEDWLEPEPVDMPWLEGPRLPLWSGPTRNEP